MENVHEILDLWAKLKGFNPDDKSGSYRDWMLRNEMGILARAQELDPTDALTLMLLDERVEENAAAAKFTVADILDRREAVEARVATSARLRELLRTSGMPEMRANLRLRATAALHQYGAGGREDVAGIIGGRGSIADLWYNALHAMDSALETHQFLHGEPDTARPLYQTHVLGFWSVNDMLRICSAMPSGISLCMVRDSDAVHSFFCFAIRNGGTLTVVTDRTKQAHPLQNRMSRKPERTLDARMAKAYFPYELLEIQYQVDEDGDIVGLNVPRQEGVVPAQQRAFRLRAIKDLGAQEVVWATFMIALLSKRFFDEDVRLPSLSYTGEMVSLPRLIEAVADRAGLPVPVGAYMPLEAAPITSAALDTEAVLRDADVRSSTYQNAWMEERYRHLVDDSLIDQEAAPDKARLWLMRDGTAKLGDEDRDWGTCSAWASRGMEGRVAQLERFDLTGFGSAERVLADRVWIARHNQAKAIGVLAKREYDARRDEVFAWWRGAVEANRKALLDAAVTGTFPVHSDRFADLPVTGFKVGPRGTRDILRVSAFDPDEVNYDLIGEGVTRLGRQVTRKDSQGRERGTGRYRCAVTDRPAGTLAVFRPENADDLAAMAGCAVDGLPDVLRHWQHRQAYAGNHILERIDPLEWAATNPWSKLTLRVAAFLSGVLYPAPKK